MTDMLESIRQYLPDFEPFVVESDVCVREIPRWQFDIANTVTIEVLWEANDFEIAESYFRRLMSGEIAPAIIVNNKIIVDGHHRIYAYRKWQKYGGPRTIPAIDLKDLMAIVDRWYSLE